MQNAGSDSLALGVLLEVLHSNQVIVGAIGPGGEGSKPSCVVLGILREA